MTTGKRFELSTVNVPHKWEGGRKAEKEERDNNVAIYLLLLEVDCIRSVELDEKSLMTKKEETKHQGHLKRKVLELSLGGRHAENQERSALCHSGRDYKTWSWTPWVQTPPLPFHRSVASALLFNLSGSVSSFVKWRGWLGNKNFYLTGVL